MQRTISTTTSVIVIGRLIRPILDNDGRFLDACREALADTCQVRCPSPGSVLSITQWLSFSVAELVVISVLEFRTQHCE